MATDIQKHLNTTSEHLSPEDQDALEALYAHYDANQDGSLTIEGEDGTECSADGYVDIDQYEYAELLNEEATIFLPYGLWHNTSKETIEAIQRPSLQPLRSRRFHDELSAPQQELDVAPRTFEALTSKINTAYAASLQPILKQGISNLRAVQQNPEQTLLALSICYFANPNAPEAALTRALTDLGYRPSDAATQAKLIKTGLDSRFGQTDGQDSKEVAKKLAHYKQAPSPFFSAYNDAEAAATILKDALRPLTTEDSLNDLLIEPFRNIFSYGLKPAIDTAIANLHQTLREFPDLMASNPWALFEHLPASPARDRLLAEILGVPAYTGQKAFQWIQAAANHKPYTINAALLKAHPDLPRQINALAANKNRFQAREQATATAYMLSTFLIFLPIGMMTANPMAPAGLSLLLATTVGATSSTTMAAINSVQASNQAKHDAALYAAGNATREPLIAHAEVSRSDRTAEGLTRAIPLHGLIGGLTGFVGLRVIKGGLSPIDTGLRSFAVASGSGITEWGADLGMTRGYENRPMTDLAQEAFTVAATSGFMGIAGDAAGRGLGRAWQGRRSRFQPNEVTPTATQNPPQETTAPATAAPKALPPEAPAPATKTAPEMSPTLPSSSIELPLGSSDAHAVDAAIATYRANMNDPAEIVWVGIGNRMCKVRIEQNGTHQVEADYNPLFVAENEHLLAPFLGTTQNTDVPGEIMRLIYPYMADQDYSPASHVVWPRLALSPPDLLHTQPSDLFNISALPSLIHPTQFPLSSTHPLTPILKEKGIAYAVVEQNGQNKVVEITWKEGKLTATSDGKDAPDILPSHITQGFGSIVDARAQAKGEHVVKALASARKHGQVYVTTDGYTTTSPNRQGYSQRSPTNEPVFVKITRQQLEFALQNNHVLVTRTRTRAGTHDDVTFDALSKAAPTPLAALKQTKSQKPLTRVLSTFPEASTTPLTPAQIRNAQAFLNAHPELTPDHLITLARAETIVVPDITADGAYVTRTVTREELLKALTSDNIFLSYENPPATPATTTQAPESLMESDTTWLHDTLDDLFSTLISSKHLLYATPAGQTPKENPLQRFSALWIDSSVFTPSSEVFVVTRNNLGNHNIGKVTKQIPANQNGQGPAMKTTTGNVGPTEIYEVIRGRDDLVAFLNKKLGPPSFSLDANTPNPLSEPLADAIIRGDLSSLIAQDVGGWRDNNPLTTQEVLNLILDPYSAGSASNTLIPIANDRLYSDNAHYWN